jgi:hypothetical protein
VGVGVLVGTVGVRVGVGVSGVLVGVEVLEGVRVGDKVFVRVGV